jgi:HPt (histidine-containing phosphotransfer) domain-containing protein
MSEFDAQLAALRLRFVEQASADAREIERHAAALAWPAVRDLSHGIAGRAGMFGFSALTDAARKVEEAIDKGASSDRLGSLAGALVSDLRGLSGAR